MTGKGDRRRPMAVSQTEFDAKFEAIFGTKEAQTPAVECCNNPSQCWEPCGDLGKSEEHARLSESSDIDTCWLTVDCKGQMSHTLLESFCPACNKSSSFEEK